MRLRATVTNLLDAWDLYVDDEPRPMWPNQFHEQLVEAVEALREANQLEAGMALSVTINTARALTMLSRAEREAMGSGRRLKYLVYVRDDVQEEITDEVAVMVGRGHPWATIGTLLGVSKQGARQRYGATSPRRAKTTQIKPPQTEPPPAEELHHNSGAPPALEVAGTAPDQSTADERNHDGHEAAADVRRLPHPRGHLRSPGV